MDRRKFVRDSLISVAGISKLLSSTAPNGSALFGATPAASASVESPATRLFATDLPGSKWVQFPAAGFCKSGHRSDIPQLRNPPPTACRSAVIDTGCIDLETSGLWGYSTIFNSHVPRRGPLNLPFLGSAWADKPGSCAIPSRSSNTRPPTALFPSSRYNTELLFDSVRVPQGDSLLGTLPGGRHGI